MKAQGFDRRKLVYSSSLQPYLSYWGIFWTIFFILVNGYAVFWDFNASGFLTACAFSSLTVLSYGILIELSFLQTSTSHSSSHCTSAGRSSSARRSGSRMRWTSSPASHRSRRPSSRNSRQETSGTRSSTSCSKMALSAVVVLCRRRSLSSLSYGVGYRNSCVGLRVFLKTSN